MKLRIRRNRRVRRRPTIVHASSAHPWTDNRVHLREAAGLAAAEYDVILIAVDRDADLPPTGVNVIRIPAYSRWKRVTWGAATVIAQALRLRPDVVHIHDPELVWAVPLLRCMQKIVVYDAHEDLPSQVASKQYVRPSLRRAFIGLAHVVVWIAGYSSMVVAATEQVGERFPSRKTILVRNYPRVRDIEDDLPPPSRRPPQIAYVGAISVNRGARVLVDSLATELFPSRWRLALAGQSASPRLLEELKERPGWERVDFSGWVTPMRARDISASSRVGMCVLGRTRAHLDALPTKMFEYMSSGTPVIVSDFPLWRDIVEKYRCGVVVDEGSPEAVAAAVRMYAEDEFTMDAHGRNARAAVLHELNWTREEQTLLEGYRRILRCRVP